MCLLFTARNLNNKIDNYIKMFMLNFVFFLMQIMDIFFSCRFLSKFLNKTSKKSHVITIFYKSLKNIAGEK
jgi:hypothetical protein